MIQKSSVLFILRRDLTPVLFATLVKVGSRRTFQPTMMTKVRNYPVSLEPFIAWKRHYWDPKHSDAVSFHEEFVPLYRIGFDVCHIIYTLLYETNSIYAEAIRTFSMASNRWRTHRKNFTTSLTTARSIWKQNWHRYITGLRINRETYWSYYFKTIFLTCGIDIAIIQNVLSRALPRIVWIDSHEWSTRSNLKCVRQTLW